ncbi:hypothetical protein [Virgibacillus sp. DJP39]|uniref:hypothetical protein n=1 Tax=Virgibacillus sp. DJP39 TaxID=3409790 RepID=UPI003BB68BC4
MGNNQEEESLKKHLTKEMNSIKVPKGLKEEIWTQVKSVRKKRKLNSRVVLPYIATLACVAILVALGLSGFPFNSKPTPSEIVTTQDENIQTIEAVLQKALNGPTDEWKQVSETGLEEFVNYEEKLYKNYFANETSYLHFVNNYSYSLMVEPLRNNYKLKVKNIEYEKSDSKEIIYNFAVEVQYQKEGSKSSEVEVLHGEANMNEEHKIEGMVIRDKDFYKLFYK